MRGGAFGGGGREDGVVEWGKGEEVRWGGGVGGCEVEDKETRDLKKKNGLIYSNRQRFPV